MPFLVKVAATTLGVWVAVQLVSGLQFTGSLVGLLAVGLILGVVNAFARPIVTILSLPFIVLTLGLFLLIINTMMFGLTIWLSDALALGLTSSGFWSTFFGAMVVTIVVWIADAIIDLRGTGTSLARNRLRVLEVISPCEAQFVRRVDTAVLNDMALRVGAAMAAGRHRYVMLHVERSQVEKLRHVFPGLESPTILPLAGLEDRVAVHFVVGADELWDRLSDLRALGATGIVAVTPQAIL